MEPRISWLNVCVLVSVITGCSRVRTQSSSPGPGPEQTSNAIPQFPSPPPPPTPTATPEFIALTTHSADASTTNTSAMAGNVGVLAALRASPSSGGAEFTGSNPTEGFGSFGVMAGGSESGIGIGSLSTVRGPRVRPQPPVAQGLLSPNAIRRTVMRNMGQLSRCYEQGVLRSPTLAGAVRIQFTIDTAGIVTNPRVDQASPGTESVANCMVAAFRRWRFPQPESGVVQVIYPFDLVAPTP